MGRATAAKPSPKMEMSRATKMILNSGLVRRGLMSTISWESLTGVLHGWSVEARRYRVLHRWVTAFPGGPGGSGARLAQTGGAQVGPVCIDVLEGLVLGHGAVNGGPALGDAGEAGPERVLVLAVDQDQEGAVGV